MRNSLQQFNPNYSKESSNTNRMVNSQAKSISELDKLRGKLQQLEAELKELNKLRTRDWRFQINFI